MQIERITMREVHLPLVEPFTISSGTQTVRRVTILQLEDDEGVTGWSECVSGEQPNYSPETQDISWMVIRNWIAPQMLGRRFKHPGEIIPWLDREIRGHRMSKAAVEMGAWELQARRQERSLAQLLGGTRKRLATGVSLGIQPSPEKLVEKVREALQEGFHKVKIKVKPGYDVQYIQAVRRELGDETPLMVDANSAYTMRDLDVLRQLDELNLMMIEQPLAWDDVVQHADLQAQLRTPVCLDESITCLDRARDMVRLDSGRIVNIKPGRVGGFAESLAIHDFCCEKGIPVWCGGMLESGVGRAHNVALASLDHFIIPGDLSPSRRYWQQDLVEPAWEMDEKGMMQVPFDQIGMGRQVQLDRLESMAVRSEMLER